MSGQQIWATETDIEPEYPEIQVFVSDIPDDDLEIINRVAQALIDGGHLEVAQAFTAVAVTTETMPALMTLARCLVTVI